MISAESALGAWAISPKERSTELAVGKFVGVTITATNNAAPNGILRVFPEVVEWEEQRSAGVLGDATNSDALTRRVCTVQFPRDQIVGKPRAAIASMQCRQ